MANSLCDFEVVLDVRGISTFTRKSGNTGQEVLVDSGSQYNSKISAPDKEVLDLSGIKQGKQKFVVSLGFQSFQLISDNDKKYYRRIPTIFIKDIVTSLGSKEVNNIEID